MRRLAAACAAALAAGCAATSTSTRPAATSTPTPTTAAREQSALTALRARWEAPTTASPVFPADGTDSVAVAGNAAHRDLAQPQVDVYAWRGERWVQTSRLLLDVGGTVADVEQPAVPIQLAHVTHAAVPDLVVTVHYNAGPASAIVSKVSGRWRPLTFVGGVGGRGDERLDVRVTREGTVTSTENDCTPDCADGHAVVTVYHYDRARNLLVGPARGAQTNR